MVSFLRLFLFSFFLLVHENVEIMMAVSDERLVLVHQVVEDFGGSHGSLSLVLVELVVSAHVKGGTLTVDQILHNLLLVISQPLGKRFPSWVASSHLLSPVQCDVEV